MTVEIVEVTPHGRPLVCDFHFARSLESERYLWWTWRNDKLVPLALPREGQSIVLQAS
jgi:hypothetical protein